jgi:diguanylate cyclase (GGDEF)-like protein
MRRAPIAARVALHEVEPMELLMGVVAAFFAVIALMLAAVVAAQRKATRLLRRLASTEPLTGLFNRREFERVLAREIARTSRTGRSFAVLLLDLDRLKSINDACGHLAGDRAIRRVAKALRTTCRLTDAAGRIGGDEFAVILPEANETAARQFLDRVEMLLKGHRRAGLLTVSGGVAVHPADGATAEMLLSAADAALYAEKRRRAGQVYIAQTQ